MHDLICYLDFDGTLHSSDVFLSRDFGIHMKAPGRALFEWAPILEELLSPYPDVAIVLSTTWVGQWDLQFAKDVLPSELGRRVIGSTYTPENLKYFDAWPRGRQVTSDVQRRQPANWLAIDDDALGWPTDSLTHLVQTNGATGISPSAVQKHIRGILESWRPL